MTDLLSISLLFADSALGRLDYASLSQQTLMELLIDGFTKNKATIGCDPDVEISDWNGVGVDNSNEVSEINWGLMNLQGSIELKWLPLTAKKFYIDVNLLSGTIDLSCLPDGLKILELGNNRFHGTIDLTQLPSCLVRLSLCNNKFCGLTDFGKIPKSLTELHISHTHLEGEVFDFDGDLSIRSSKVKDMRKK